MKIIKFEYFNQEILIDHLRKVHLKGRPDLKIYKNACIYIKENISTDEIHFAQYYVLDKDLKEISDCRHALLDFGIDMFKLKGFIRIHSIDENTKQRQVFDLLPPVVEISKADGDIPLLNDGMHRVYSARKAGSNINVIMIENFDHSYPYYALPNDEGWKNIKHCEEVPDIKKNYRIKEYKTLFRDFNTAFLNVSQVRTDKLPKNLKVNGQKVEA